MSAKLLDPKKQTCPLFDCLQALCKWPLIYPAIVLPIPIHDVQCNGILCPKLHSKRGLTKEEEIIRGL